MWTGDLLPKRGSGAGSTGRAVVEIAVKEGDSGIARTGGVSIVSRELDCLGKRLVSSCVLWALGGGVTGPLSW